MRFNAWLQQRLAWVALCAVLFGAMAPTLSHMLAASSGANPWDELCSAYGLRNRSANLDNQKAPPASSFLVHCPFCLLQGDLPFISPGFIKSHSPIFQMGLRIAAAIGLGLPCLPSIKTAHPVRAPPAFA